MTLPLRYIQPNHGVSAPRTPSPTTTPCAFTACGVACSDVVGMIRPTPLSHSTGAGEALNPPYVSPTM